MSETEQLQRRYDALVEFFLAPLLVGGTVEVDPQPLPPGALGYFRHARAGDGAKEVEIFDALHRGASALTPVTRVPWPSPDLVTLTMVAYDLVLITDPMLDRVFARKAWARSLEWVDHLLDLVGPPRTRADALSRHVILERLFELHRTDVVIKNWAYTYRFFGRPVPKNVVAMPRLRRVRQTSKRVGIRTLWAELEEKEQLAIGGRLRALAARSPITEITRPDLAADFRFSRASLEVLADDRIRGAVARALVARGEWSIATVLGRALGDPALNAAPGSLLHPAIALAFEVQMTAALDVPGTGLPASLDLSDPDLARYAAVLPAVFDDDHWLDEVRAFDPEDRRIAQKRCSRLAAVLPAEALAEVAPLVARAERAKAPASPAPIAPIEEVAQ